MRWGGKSLDSAMTKIRGLVPRACHLEALFADLRESAPVRPCILLRFGRLSVEFARFRFGGPARPVLPWPPGLASKTQGRAGQGQGGQGPNLFCVGCHPAQPALCPALPCHSANERRTCSGLLPCPALALALVLPCSLTELASNSQQPGPPCPGSCSGFWTN